MCEILFHVIVINISKVRRNFSISMSNEVAKNIYILKKCQLFFSEFYRLIFIQKHLNHSIPTNEVKVMRSFILWSMKVEKT